MCLLVLPGRLLTSGTLDVTGSDIAAVLCAAKAFKTSYPHSELKNFVIRIKGDESEVEVVFIPNPAPGPKISGANELILDVGVTTLFGDEVHYHLTRSPLKILRIRYGR